MKRRNQSKYVVYSANTERYKCSSVIAMQKLLNKNEENIKKLLKGLYNCSNDSWSFWPPR